MILKINELLFYTKVLIETYWNVNFMVALLVKNPIYVLIETYWNVNAAMSMARSHYTRS